MSGIFIQALAWGIGGIHDFSYWVCTCTFHLCDHTSCLVVTFHICFCAGVLFCYPISTVVGSRDWCVLLLIVTIITVVAGSIGFR